MLNIGEIVEVANTENQNVLGIVERQCSYSNNTYIIALTDLPYSADNLNIIKNLTTDEIYETNNCFKNQSAIISHKIFNLNIRESQYLNV